MSFYTSLDGLHNAQTDLDVIANNIANANTDGFKSSTISFADIMSSSLTTDPKLTVGLGSRVQAITQQFGLGSMQTTGNALDLAINGDGFFVTRSPDSSAVSYTRNGAFSLNSAGQLIDSSDQLVQTFAVDASGAVTSTGSTSTLTVPLTNTAGANYTGMTVSDTGVLTAAYSDGSTSAVGAIAMAGFPTNSGLKQIGDEHWTATGNSGTAVLGQAGTGDYGVLLTGELEGSNVDLSTQLVGLVGAQQAFQANAKAIDTDTQIMSTIINLRSQ